MKKTAGRTLISKLHAYLHESSTSPHASRPLRTHMLGMSAVAIVAFALAFQTSPGKKAESPMSEASAAAHGKSAQQIEGPDTSGKEGAETVAKAPPSYRQSITTEMRKGDTLFDVLKDRGIPPVQIQELVSATRPVYNLGRLRQGQIITLEYDERDGQVYRLETDLGDDRLVVEREEEDLEAHKEPLDFDIRERVVSGTIQDSLFLAADEAGLPVPLIINLAEIFAWDIDFNVDIRSDDTFVVLFEEKYLDGKFVQTGRILAAGIVNDGKPFWAFYYKDPNGHADYYDEEGKALRKAFLKSPLKYTRISSRFSHRRFHPILKIYRPHLGVDYAAPPGTPIHSIGDGKVLFAGWNNGYGRFIKIRHNDTYTSTYGHLRRFARGIRRGKYVSQGNVIGYVGASGLATGPHLDFRLLKHGRFINPLAVNFPDADPVAPDEMGPFQKQVKQYLSKLEGRDTVSPERPFELISLQLTRIRS